MDEEGWKSFMNQLELNEKMRDIYLRMEEILLEQNELQDKRREYLNSSKERLRDNMKSIYEYQKEEKIKDLTYKEKLKELEREYNVLQEEYGKLYGK